MLQREEESKVGTWLLIAESLYILGSGLAANFDNLSFSQIFMYYMQMFAKLLDSLHDPSQLYVISLKWPHHVMANLDRGLHTDRECGCLYAGHLRTRRPVKAAAELYEHARAFGSENSTEKQVVTSTVMQDPRVADSAEKNTLGRRSANLASASNGDVRSGVRALSVLVPALACLFHLSIVLSFVHFTLLHGPSDQFQYMNP